MVIFMLKICTQHNGDNLGELEMIRILKIFKPTFFALFIFVILILVQSNFTNFTGSFGPYTTKTRHEYGIIPIIIIHYEQIKKFPSLSDDDRATMSNEEYEELVKIEDTTNVEIKWDLLLLDLAFCYIFATFCSKINKFIKIRRLPLIYVLTAFCICLVIFIGSIIFSKIVWGYYLYRPKVITSLKDISQVKAVVPIKTEKGTSGGRNIIVDTDYKIPKELSKYRGDYYCREKRILIFLSDKNMLPDSLTLDLADLTELHSLITQTGILIEPDEGYDDSDLLRGIVVDALDKKGKRLVIAGVRGMELSDDHYPYYEIAFKGKQRDDLKFISGQHFFYDVAGIEGIEWDGLFIYFSLFSVPIGLIILSIILILWKLIKCCQGRYSIGLEKDK